jgi:hypothetical protein
MTLRELGWANGASAGLRERTPWARNYPRDGGKIKNYFVFTKPFFLLNFQNLLQTYLLFSN